MNPPMIKVGVVGAAGYTGGELLRLLLRHPQVEVVFAQSSSNAHKPIATVHRDLLGETDLCFSEQANLAQIDLLFLCMAHGMAKSWWEKQTIPPTLKVVDLSNDFRHGSPDAALHSFVYGLPELQRSAIATARFVANPGCFATAIQLALLPLAQAGVLPSQVYVTGITGATGAGQSLQETAHFPWRDNNISAYKTLSHQHIGEIKATIALLQHNVPQIHFVPWRGNFSRGIFISCTLTLEHNETNWTNRYQNWYKDHPFVVVSTHAIDLKQVVNTNKCAIQLEQLGDTLVVHAAIDNLLKGASGQAVQNMNCMFGLAENTGLQLKASCF